MATTKNSITRADALQFAIQACEGNAEVVEKLTTMLAQVTKPRKATISKARKANEGLAKQIHALMVQSGVGLDAKAITGLGLPEVTTTQKATAVMRVAMDLGLVTKCVNGKAITYHIA